MFWEKGGERMSTLSLRFPGGLRGSKEAYLNVLKKVPHVQPRQEDVING